MALVPCPECKASISTEAAACPQCGFGMRTGAPAAVFVRKPRTFGILCGLFLIGVGVYILAAYIPAHTLSGEYIASSLRGREPGVLTAQAAGNLRVIGWVAIALGVVEIAFWGHRLKRVK